MKRPLVNYTTSLVILASVLLLLQCGKSKKIIAPPSLSSVDPVSGIVGDPVTINGNNLQNASQVSFSGVASKIISVSATQVVTVVPQGAAIGVDNISVQADGGASNTLPFEVFNTPTQVDASPPTVSRLIPAATYSNYPILIYGDDLSGVVKLTFNDEDATIFTNNETVVTATVPQNLPAGTVIVKLTTLKGTSTMSFQSLGAASVSAPNSFANITLPPAGYLPSISNDWSCGFYSEQSSDANYHYFVDLNSGQDSDGNYNITGKFSYDFNNTKNYNDKNYIEIINQLTQDTLAGQFSSKSANPCILNMIFISSKTGLTNTCTFDTRLNFPNNGCSL